MKRIAFMVLGLLALVGVAWGSEAKDHFTVGRGHSGQIVGGWYKADSTMRYLLFDSAGNLLNSDASRDRDAYLVPTLIYSDTVATIEGTAGDTTSIVDLSAYRTVSLLFQVSGGVKSSLWRRFAVSARYNLAGASDSLSLFQIPVWGTDTLAANGHQVANGTVPLLAALSDGEFPVLLTNTATTTAGASLVASLPQGKMVPLTIIGGGTMLWPGQCSFRIRSIGQQAVIGGTGNPRPPRLKVWVLGTPL